MLASSASLLPGLGSNFQSIPTTPLLTAAKCKPNASKLYFSTFNAGVYPMARNHMAKQSSYCPPQGKLRHYRLQKPPPPPQQQPTSMLASSASLLPGLGSCSGSMTKNGTNLFMHHFTSGSPGWSAGISLCQVPPVSQACRDSSSKQASFGAAASGMHRSFR